MITIEVTAENGTSKKYIISVKRLSAKDATLSNIAVDPGTIVPDFTVDTFEYNGMYFKLYLLYSSMPGVSSRYAY